MTLHLHIKIMKTPNSWFWCGLVENLLSHWMDCWLVIVRFVIIIVNDRLLETKETAPSSDAQELARYLQQTLRY